MLDRYKILFDEVKIGPVTAPNRFFAVPHATGYAWNQPSGAIAIRAMKAEGGWGTVAVRLLKFHQILTFANHPMERIWDDTDILRHAKGVEQIKSMEVCQQMNWDMEACVHVIFYLVRL